MKKHPERIQISNLHPKMALKLNDIVQEKGFSNGSQAIIYCILQEWERIDYFRRKDAR